MNVLILGAGPAGLAAALRLKQKGARVLVLEKEAQAGGLCRSATVDGWPLDIGGGHFLDANKPIARDFVFSFMPESEWNRFDRDSRIRLRGALISHPLEANLWQLPEALQAEYLSSIACAGCVTGAPAPARFTDWVRWKLGDRIAEDYMLPYNRKLFGQNLNQLGVYWLSKLPGVSYDDTLLSCRLRRAVAVQPGHASFYYPQKVGYGECWRRMAEALNGDILFDDPCVSLDFSRRRAVTASGEAYFADQIIVTLPWSSLALCGAPDEIQNDARALSHVGMTLSYLPDAPDTPAHWVYEPDEGISYHRILNRARFLPGSPGCWTESNPARALKGDFVNPFAYPLNTVDKPAHIARLLAFARARGVHGLGRWGEHEHYNSDAVVERALRLADEM